MCWASNHQNIYRNGPRAHFPFNLPLFGDLCQHIKSNSKCNNIFKEKLKSANLRPICFIKIWHIWITFATTWFIFTKHVLFPIYQKHLFWQIKRSFKSKFDQMPKTPPFPIIKFLPHKGTFFLQ
jgi:hypothetical protein